MLNLAKNQIDAEGAQYLANALQANTVRQFLFLSIIYSPSSLHTDTHNADH